MMYRFMQYLAEDEIDLKKTDPSENRVYVKEVRALRGYFGPPWKLKNKNCFSAFSSHHFIRRIAQV